MTQKTKGTSRKRPFLTNNDGSIIPILLYVLTIFAVGALYSLFFIEVAFPGIRYLLPTSDANTFTMMGIYAIPLFVIIVGTLALLKEGLKRNFYYPPTGGQL